MTFEKDEKKDTKKTKHRKKVTRSRILECQCKSIRAVCVLCSKDVFLRGPIDDNGRTERIICMYSIKDRLSSSEKNDSRNDFDPAWKVVILQPTKFFFLSLSFSQKKKKKKSQIHLTGN
jgi:hypothetical protein